MRVGLGCTLIGPVMIGDKVNIARNVVISGLNHKFENANMMITDQGIETKQIIIKDDVWIGTNSLVLGE